MNSPGLVDVVVVYKIDRLSRSLVDFTKLVEVFDANNVTFVSVTQSFNTTTSMGRLTLNILLSFAQFEREVIGERIRDKVAASRKRGMWMGGYVPLGYDVRERKLVVNDGEAALVRRIRGPTLGPLLPGAPPGGTRSGLRGSDPRQGAYSPRRKCWSAMSFSFAVASASQAVSPHSTASGSAPKWSSLAPCSSASKASNSAFFARKAARLFSWLRAARASRSVMLVSVVVQGIPCA